MATFDASDYGLSTTYTFDFNTQSEGLSDLLKDLQAAGYGLAAMKAAAAAFIENLRSVDSSGKGIDEITRKAEDLRKVLAKLGIGGFDSNIRRVLEAQIDTKQLHIISGTGLNLSEKADALARFDANTPNALRGNGSPLQAFLRMSGQLRMITRQITGFLNEVAKVNREILLLSYNTQLAVREIAAMGGALEAYGGTKGAAANFARSFEVELAKMQVGQGTGGKFMEAARLWGVEWHPEDFEEQERAIVRRLSDPSLTRTQRIGIQNTLGLDSGQMSRYSRGLEEFERENARQKELTKNLDEMSRASDEYLRAQQHLKAAWEDMKNGFLAPMLRLITPFVEKLSEISVWMRDNPFGQFLGILLTLGGVIGGVGIKIARLMATFRMAGWAGSAASAIGGSAGRTWETVVRNGSGAVASAAGAVGSIASGVVGLFSMSEIQNIKHILAGWFHMWVAINGATGQSRNQAVEMLVHGFEEYNNAVKYNKYGKDIIGVWAKNMEIQSNNKSFENSLAAKYYYNANNSAGASPSAQITIEQIDISVESDSADPSSVANAVHEVLLSKMRDVVVSLEPGGRV